MGGAASAICLRVGPTTRAESSLMDACMNISARMRVSPLPSCTACSSCGKKAGHSSGQSVRAILATMTLICWAYATLGRAPGVAAWEALERQGVEAAYSLEAYGLETWGLGFGGF